MIFRDFPPNSGGESGTGTVDDIVLWVAVDAISVAFVVVDVFVSFEMTSSNWFSSCSLANLARISRALSSITTSVVVVVISKDADVVELEFASTDFDVVKVVVARPEKAYFIVSDCHQG